MDFDLTKMFLYINEEDRIRYVKDIVISINENDLIGTLESSFLEDKPSLIKRIRFIYHYAFCKSNWERKSETYKEVMSLYDSEIMIIRDKVINEYLKDFPFQKKLSEYIDVLIYSEIKSAYLDKEIAIGALQKHLPYLSKSFIRRRDEFDLIIDDARLEEMALYCILGKRDELELSADEETFFNKNFPKKEISNSEEQEDIKKSNIFKNIDQEKFADKIIEDRVDEYGAKWLFMNHMELDDLDYEEQKKIIFKYAEKYDFDFDKYSKDEIDSFIEILADLESLSICVDANYNGWGLEPRLPKSNKKRANRNRDSMKK